MLHNRAAINAASFACSGRVGPQRPSPRQSTPLPHPLLGERPFCEARKATSTRQASCSTQVCRGHARWASAIASREERYVEAALDNRGNPASVTVGGLRSLLVRWRPCLRRSRSAAGDDAELCP